MKTAIPTNLPADSSLLTAAELNGIKLSKTRTVITREVIDSEEKQR